MSDEKPQLNRLEIMRALKYSNWDAVYATAFAILTGGAFLTGFALYLKANDFWMGIIFSVPMLAGLFQIVSSYFVELSGNRKRFCGTYSLLGRILFLPILLIPFIIPPHFRFLVFALLFLLSNVLLSITQPAWSSWISDLVPQDMRGRYFGKRNMLAGLTTLIISMPAGWFLDQATKYHRFPESVGFASLFGVAVICALLSFAALMHQAEPPMVRSDVNHTAGLKGALSFYRMPFLDREFRAYVLFGGLFAFSQFFAAPFFLVYQLEKLKFSYTVIQVFTVYTSLLSMISLPLWGYIGDKFGNKPIIAISTAGVALLPLLWDFTTRKHLLMAYLIVTFINTASGVFWAGVGLGQFNLLIASTPMKNKSVYVGAWSAVVGLAGGIAPILSGILMTAFKPVHFVVQDFLIGNYQIVFFINTILRFVALASLKPVVERGSASAKEVLAQIGSAPVGSWKQIRRLQKSTNEEEKLEAAQSLKSSRTTLAVEELIAALDDPSLHVREEAAIALGEIRDPRATPALLSKLADPASGIVEECALALGSIGDPQAVKALGEVLETGETIDSLAAAKAIGKIRCVESQELLLKALNSETTKNKPGLAEACIRALGNSGSERVARELERYLEHGNASLQRAVVRALGDIGSKSSASALMKLLDEQKDPAMISRIAVSLAMCGASEAIPNLLASLEVVYSPVARKQIINAIGNLVGVEDRLYPILAMESYDRDQAVSRIFQEMLRKERAASRESFSAKRRYRSLQLAAEHYQDGRYVEAAQILIRYASDQKESKSAQAIIDWMEKRTREGVLNSEEFLLLLLVFK